MAFTVDSNTPADSAAKFAANIAWFHGSNAVFSELRAGSTITPWRKLAEAFSHKPAMLCIDGETITHNGVEHGYLYAVEDVSPEDVYPHPRSTMEAGLEYLTKRPLSVRLLCELNPDPQK